MLPLSLVKPHRLAEQVCGFLWASGHDQDLCEIHPNVRTVDWEVGPVDERHCLASQLLALLDPTQLGDGLGSRGARIRPLKDGGIHFLDRQCQVLRLLVSLLHVHGLSQVGAHDPTIRPCTRSPECLEPPAEQTFRGVCIAREHLQETCILSQPGHRQVQSQLLEHLDASRLEDSSLVKTTLKDVKPAGQAEHVGLGQQITLHLLQDLVTTSLSVPHRSRAEHSYGGEPS